MWTTDTNRQQLVELDGNTLIEKSRIQLSLDCGGWQFLGMATPSQGKASEESRTQPLVTLVRFANGMTKGRVSDIFSDGSQMDYPAISTTEPRGIQWHGNELLMVDGASYSIKRYSDSRTLMDDFGDRQVKAEFAASLNLRNSLKIQYVAYLAEAISLFFIGFAFALRAQALEKTKILADLNVDLSQIGTPMLSALARSKASVKLFLPMISVFAVVTPFLFFLDPLLRFLSVKPQSPSLLILILLQLLLIIAPIMVRRNLRRNENNPAIEGIFNQKAIHFLQTDAAFWRLCHPEELPQETLMFINARKGASWLVLTNQRLLVFMVNLRDRTLACEYLRSDILRLRILETQEMTWMHRLQRFLSGIGVMTRIEFKDGTSLTGFTHSAQTARRMAAQMQITPFDTRPMSETNWAQPAHEKAHTLAPFNNNAIRQTIASFLIPGLGQWVQRRSGTALILFVTWLLALMSVIVVVWTVWNTLAAVSLLVILYTAGTYIFICLLAARDAWRMRKRE